MAEITHEALFELQEKTELHKSHLERCMVRKQMKGREAKRIAYGLQDLEGLPETTKTYPAVGRAFVFKTVAESQELLTSEIKEIEDSMETVDKEAAYHSSQLESCSKQLKEIMDERQKRMADREGGSLNVE